MIRSHWLFWFAILAPAADYTEQAANFNQWFSYAGDHGVGASKWGVHFDASLRRSDALRQRQQFLWRPGVNYQLHKNVQLQSAYTWLRTYPYGAAPTSSQLEHRVWEQLVFSHRQGRVQWSHRGRWEQRWLNRRYARGESGPANTVFEQRARYALRATVPLRGAYYWSLGEETFLPVKPETHPALVDQQRAIVTLGKRLNADLRIEFGYMYQAIWQRNGRIRENNHTLMINFFNTMPLGQWLGRLR